ncbi:hypothetical protein HJFPF1_12304 [Paramyrothecium foliicola]|nr:hypothetical protein HJFPF1_12304 [Paramyrothecium foliicola]
MAPVGTITNDTYLGIGIFMIVLTVPFVLARTVISIRQYKGLLPDDWLTYLGYIIMVGLYTFNEFQYKKLLDPTTIDLTDQTKTGLAIPIVAAFSLWTSKAPILMVYIRIFGVQAWLRWACHIVLIVSALGYIASFIPAIIKCRPLDTPHTPEKWVECSESNFTGSAVAGVVSVVVDLCILIFPLRPIYLLNLSTRRKIGLGIVFCSGIFGLLASILSLVYKIQLFHGKLANLGGVLATMLLQLVESAIALIVGCVPAASGFWYGFIKTSGVWGSIASFGTRLVSNIVTVTTKSNSKSISQYRDENYDTARLHSIRSRGNNDTYILMDSSSLAEHGTPKSHR